jgi:predicted alpha-1,6-mannanase (GH76 family)
LLRSRRHRGALVTLALCLGVVGCGVGCGASDGARETAPEAEAGSPHGDDAASASDAGIDVDADAGSSAVQALVDAGPPEPPFDAGPIPPVVEAGSGDDWQALDNAALQAFAQMYSTSTGQWTTGPRWSFANGVEAAESSFARSGGQNSLDLIVATYDLNSSGKFIDDLGYDDEAWWGHAWVRAYDLTGKAVYLAAAKTIFADMTTAWDTGTCGGGIWWNRNRNYKNAITNELFLLLAASLHNRTAGDTGAGSYLDWANKEWAWFDGSGIINGSSLVNDGLSPGPNAAICTNNGQTTWTYNQGVILGGLAELYEATGDATYLARAESIADAALKALTNASGVMQEPCGSGGCNSDQIGFKGIFVRNLARLYDHDRNPSYFDFIVTNARSAWAKDRDANSEFGGNWSGPFDTASAPGQASAMFALSALADPISPSSIFLRPAAGPTFNHALGARDGVLGWACDAASCPAAGLMQSGPYVSYLPLGGHTAHFRLAAGAISARTDALATLQVFDSKSSAVLASRAVAWSDFVQSGPSQEFLVPYTQTTAGDPVEYRISWAALSGAPRLVATDVSVDGEQAFSGVNLGHECGRLDGNWLWSVNRLDDAKACLATTGPYVALAQGDYVANFELRVDEFAQDDASLASLSVVDRDLGTTVASLGVHRSLFATTMFQTFAVPFHAVAGHHWDLRTQWLAAPNAPRMHVRGVYVRSAAQETPVTLPFNQRGLGAAPADGSLDSAGSALDLALVGTKVTSAYDSFTIAQSGNDVLQGGGPQVAVPSGQYASLELLGLAINGTQAAQNFAVAYADGTSQTVVRSMSDWTSPTPQASEQIALCMPYRWSTTAKEYGNFHLFQYSLPIDSTRGLHGFTLPANANVKIVAATLVAAQ